VPIRIRVVSKNTDPCRTLVPIQRSKTRWYLKINKIAVFFLEYYRNSADSALLRSLEMGTCKLSDIQLRNVTRFDFGRSFCREAGKLLVIFSNN